MDVLCNFHISSHPLNKQQEPITLPEGEKISFYLLNGKGLETIVLPWKCHSGNIMKLCADCNNSTKFQFYRPNALSTQAPRSGAKERPIVTKHNLDLIAN